MSKAVISGLTEKLAETLGLVEHYQAQLTQLEEQKAHLMATLMLFNPAFDEAKVKPRRPVERPAKVAEPVTAAVPAAQSEAAAQ